MYTHFPGEAHGSVMRGEIGVVLRPGGRKLLYWDSLPQLDGITRLRCLQLFSVSLLDDGMMGVS